MHPVNSYKIRLITTGTTIADKQIVLPIGTIFDGIGQNEQIENYVSVLADDAINPIVDYEKMRYAPVITSGGTPISSVSYDFKFYGQPIWDDYKKVDNSYTNIQFDQDWNNPDGKIITYPTPSSFHYTNIDGKITWSLSDALLTIILPDTPVQTIAFMNAILEDKEIVGRYKVNNTQVSPNLGLAVSNAGSFQGNYSGQHPANIVQMVKTNGDSYIEQTLGSPLNITLWMRKVSISGVFDVSGLNPSDTLSIELRTGRYFAPGVPQDPWKVFCVAEGYKLRYEGTSHPPSEGYYTDYPTTNIPSTYIENSFKGYTNSFFRLDFYDSVLEKAQNLLFTDIMTVSEGTEQEKAEFDPTLNAKGATQNYYLYWLKDDPIIQEHGYRDVWMIAHFFNAVTGQIIDFFNTGTFLGGIPTLDQYKTLLKYTKVRLYKDYTYMICKREVIPPTMIAPGVPGPNPWQITDSNNIGINHLTLSQIRIKS